MTEGRSASGQAEGRGPLVLLARVDTALFRLEQTAVATALLAMSTVVFLDVLYLRLTAPDSKVAGWIAAWLDEHRPEALEALHARTGPLLAAIAVSLLVVVGAFGAQRARGRPWLGRSWGALVVALGTLATLAAAGWLFVRLEPRDFLVLLYVSVVLALVVRWVRARPEGWRVRVGAQLVLAPAVIAFVRRFVPEGYGYGWAQELSLLLLLWVGFLGMSICAYAGKHMRLEAFERLLPAGWARPVHAAGFLLAALFCAYLGWAGADYLRAAQPGALFGQMMETPEWAGMGIVPVAFGVAAARFTGAAVSALRGGRYGRPADDEALEAARRLAAASGEGTSEARS
ncbi:MAG: TRAP transporter small permease [Myxococcota bacterium]|nr:TRAP transporter small permease [Myxococcota bacterium]MDW8363453.1 TRAP transporter small permease [Myxococcales bacterium]